MGINIMFPPFLSSFFPVRRHQATAFTLSELLIAILLLGLISVMAVPKIIKSVEDNRKRAIFKETIASVHSVLFLKVQNGDIPIGATNTGQVFNPLTSGLNSVSICNGCTPNPTGHFTLNYGAPALTLMNGAMVAINAGNTDGGYGSNCWMTIDYNGLTGPNTFGEDQLQLYVCINNVFQGWGGICNARTGMDIPYGNSVIRLFPLNPLGSTSWQLYNWIYR